MRMIDGQAACDIAAKLRVIAAVLACSVQKDLYAVVRRINPETGFDRDRSYKWMHGKTIPRLPKIYQDWAAMLRLTRPGAWVACALAPQPTPLADDLSALGLSIGEPVDLEARLRRFLDAPEEPGPGTVRVVMADHVALAFACDRIWLDNVATGALPAPQCAGEMVCGAQ